tara:strand:- start:3548 stop:3937 length:390 start_codon:yes stop_codon:yes gene_type:complete
MEFSTFAQVSAIDTYEQTKKLNELKEMKITKLPSSPNEHTESNESNESPFLDISVRTLLDNFVMTWHKIIIDLLNLELYAQDDTKEWWDRFYAIIIRVLSVFWAPDRIFYVGVGLVVASFFTFFIFAAS